MVWLENPPSGWLRLFNMLLLSDSQPLWWHLSKSLSAHQSCSSNSVCLIFFFFYNRMRLWFFFLSIRTHLVVVWFTGVGFKKGRHALNKVKSIREMFNKGFHTPSAAAPTSALSWQDICNLVILLYLPLQQNKSSEFIFVIESGYCYFCRSLDWTLIAAAQNLIHI